MEKHILLLKKLTENNSNFGIYSWVKKDVKGIVYTSIEAYAEHNGTRYFLAKAENNVWEVDMNAVIEFFIQNEKGKTANF